MPTITALPPVSLRDLATANLASTGRSEGCHVTQIVDAIMREYGGRSRPKDFEQLDSENWQEAGFVWEEILSRTFAERQRQGNDGTVERWRPGEITKDSIIGSPDGIALGPDGSMWLEEYKCTWKTSKTFDLHDKRYLPWLLQIMAYCHLADVRECHLYVLHINGAYEGFIPAVVAWRLQFSDAEIQANWYSLQRKALKEGWI